MTKLRPGKARWVCPKSHIRSDRTGMPTPKWSKKEAIFLYNGYTVWGTCPPDTASLGNFMRWRWEEQTELRKHAVSPEHSPARCRPVALAAFPRCGETSCWGWVSCQQRSFSCPPAKMGLPLGSQPCDGCHPSLYSSGTKTHGSTWGG